MDLDSDNEDGESSHEIERNPDDLGLRDGSLDENRRRCENKKDEASLSGDEEAIRRHDDMRRICKEYREKEFTLGDGRITIENFFNNACAAAREARKEQERDEAMQKQCSLLQQIVVECNECHEEKLGEEFPAPTLDPRRRRFKISTVCQACADASKTREKQEQHDKSINEALMMKRRFGVEDYKYEPKDDELFYVRNPTLTTQEKHLRQALLGKYHILYVRLIDDDNFGAMQCVIYTGGTVTLDEKKIEERDEENKQTTTRILLCGNVSLGPDVDYSALKPSKMKLDFIEESNRGIVEESVGEEPRPQRKTTDWAVDLELPNYLDDEGPIERADVDETHWNYLKPHMIMKVIDQRHPCPYVPKEHPFERANNSYDHDTCCFPSLQAAERIAGDYEDSSKSWICNHLHLPSAVARTIHDFVAWRPRPVFFFEPGDLWIQLRSHWIANEALVKTSCYMIARPANTCEEKIRVEQAVQNVLQSRYDDRLLALRPYIDNFDQVISGRTPFQSISTIRQQAQYLF